MNVSRSTSVNKRSREGLAFVSNSFMEIRVTISVEVIHCNQILQKAGRPMPRIHVRLLWAD